MSGDLVVQVGATLTIEAGASLFFDQDARMTVLGGLVAGGTLYDGSTSR